MRYTEAQRQIALKLYDETHLVSKVIHRLGYPSKIGMYTWIGIRNRPLWQKGVRKRLINTPKHPLHPPLSLKKEILNVLKKDPGINITVLKNREKADTDIEEFMHCLNA